MSDSVETVRIIETEAGAALMRLQHVLRRTAELVPASMQWRDARVEAPPEGVSVLVVRCGSVEFASYEGENGQPYRRLPNHECWGHWMTHQHGSTYEGAEQIRWWMPVPNPPEGA